MTPPGAVPRLHPRLADLYRDKVADLQASLNRDETRAEAAEALRALIDEIRLRPDPQTGVLRAELFGELGAILRLVEDSNDERPGAGAMGRQLSLVAGARNRRQQQGLFQAAA